MVEEWLFTKHGSLMMSLIISGVACTVAWMGDWQLALLALPFTTVLLTIHRHLHLRDLRLIQEHEAYQRKRHLLLSTPLERHAESSRIFEPNPITKIV